MTKPPTGTSNQTPGRPLSARQSAEGPQVGTQRGEGGEFGPQNGAQGRAIRQLTAERDLLARTVAVYTRRSAADALAETREALAPGGQPMTDLHLIITRPEPGEWLGRLDIVEALEKAGPAIPTCR